MFRSELLVGFKSWVRFQLKFKVYFKSQVNVYAISPDKSNRRKNLYFVVYV